MSNQGEKGSRIKARIGKENFQIITCICPFDCPQICQPHSPFSVPTRLPALKMCCWGLPGATLPQTQRCSVITSEACFGKRGKVSWLGWVTPFSQKGGRRGKTASFHSPLQKVSCCFKEFSSLPPWMWVALLGSVCSSRIQTEILPGVSVFEPCLLCP